MPGKAAYLSALTSKFRFKSVEVGQNMQGTTPPSVFLGSCGYPKILIGPMLTPVEGDTSVMDTPEAWIPQGKQQPEIINFRLSLVRGQSAMGVKELDNRLVLQLQEVALSKSSVDAEAEFAKRPRGFQFNEEHQPFGPSAPLKEFSAGAPKWQHQLEKAYYDTDLKAADAVIESYNKGLLVSQIQKAFSVGAMGTQRRRRLVPTKWSITAVDDILGKHLLESVKLNPVIDSFRLYEYSTLKNYFAILLTPNAWQYEWIEAFIRVLGSEEVIFSDWEGFEGKKEYSSVGGCFYSVRLAVAEKLAERGEQAGAIVFREAYPGYVPLGVWLCREISRRALETSPKEFQSIRTVLSYLSTKLWLPTPRFIATSMLLKKMIGLSRLSEKQSMFA